MFASVFSNLFVSVVLVPNCCKRSLLITLLMSRKIRLQTRRVYWFDYKFKKVLAPLHYPLSSQSSLLLFDLCYPIYCRVLKSENLFYANSLMWYFTVRYVVKVLLVKSFGVLFFICMCFYWCVKLNYFKKQQKLVLTFPYLR